MNASSVMVASGLSASVSPVLMTNPKPKGFGKTAEIVTARRLNLSAIREAYRQACKDEMKLAFPAPSRWACAKEAAKIFGESPDRFERILAGETASPDFPLMLAVGAVYSRKTGKQSAILKFVNALTDGGDYAR
jgi:hypothetical protein